MASLNDSRRFLKNVFVALAGAAQWIEGQPANQRVAGSIPSQSGGSGPQYGGR